MSAAPCAVKIRLSGKQTLKQVGNYFNCSSALVLTWLKKNQPDFRETLLAKRKNTSSAFCSLIGRYKRKARQRGLSWDLSKEDFKELTSSDCSYCKEPPFAITKAESLYGGNLKYTGIDRIDSKKGYELSNCVPCCRWCNQAKGTMSVEAFKVHITKLFERFVNA